MRLKGILALGLVALGGCQAVGPSTFADANGARTTFFPGSSLSLNTDGTWTAASPQNFTSSGGDITDDRLSAIMPQTFHGFRINGDSIGFVSGGNLSIKGSTITLEEREVEGGDRDVYISGWSFDELTIDNAEFYALLSQVADEWASIAVSLGDDATEQVKAQLEAAKEVADGLGKSIIEAAIQGLTGGTP